MSQYHQQDSLNTTSAGSIPNSIYNNQQQDAALVAKHPRQRRDEYNSAIDQLHRATLRIRLAEKRLARTSQRRNRNEVYAIANAILAKEKHLNGAAYSRDVELVQGINTNISNGEFSLVLRTDGRIIVMSDEAETHLGKPMRSLYSQCINIFECLDETDGQKLRSILDSSADARAQEEHRLVCTFRLPKGKRPSRIREDIKLIAMAGHFYSCHNSSSPYEKLFVARCEAFISRTITQTGSITSQTDSINTNTNSNTMLTFTLNDDMSINTVSANVEDILRYRKHELTGVWFGRLLPTDDMEHFEANRAKSYQQQLPSSICDIFDVYTKNGNGRLTFIYQIRPKRERRAPTIKFVVTAQLIDPSLRNDYMKYVQSELVISPNSSARAEQVNLVSSPTRNTSNDALLANSPSLSGGLLSFGNVDTNDLIHQYSPPSRSLSNDVAPVNISNEPWPDFFTFDFEQYPIETSFRYESTQSFDQGSPSQALKRIFDDYLDSTIVDDFLDPTIVDDYLDFTFVDDILC